MLFSYSHLFFFLIFFYLFFSVFVSSAFFCICVFWKLVFTGILRKFKWNQPDILPPAFQIQFKYKTRWKNSFHRTVIFFFRFILTSCVHSFYSHALTSLFSPYSRLLNSPSTIFIGAFFGSTPNWWFVHHICGNKMGIIFFFSFINWKKYKSKSIQILWLYNIPSLEFSKV